MPSPILCTPLILATLSTMPALQAADATRPEAFSWITDSPSDQPSTASPPRLELNLAVQPTTAPAQFACPPRVGFRLILRSLAPSRRYRVRRDWTIAPTTKTTPSASALHRDDELQRPTIGLHPSARHDCTHIRSLAEAVMSAPTELETHRAIAAFESAIRTSTCPISSSYASAVQSSTESHLIHLALYPSDRMSVVVERLAPAGSGVEATWRFDLVTPVPPRSWDAPNERSWIVATTSRLVIDMVRYATGRRLTAGPVAAEPASEVDDLTYTVHYTDGAGHPKQIPVRLTDHIWSPDGYAPLVAAEADIPVVERADDSAPAMLAALLEPRATALASLGRRLSERLAANMFDPESHEAAALLLGVFSLREAAGSLSDTRPNLCRMAAHLAMATALRRGGSLSRTGRHAEALLLTLVARQREAINRIERLEASALTPFEQAFISALRLRLTRDWRRTPAPENASLLLRLEHFRALHESLGSSKAHEFLASFPLDAVSDWARIAAESGMSVELGHLLAPTVLDLELAEIAETWATEHGSPLTGDPIESLRSASPSLFVETKDGRALPRVIDWGLWAAFYRRNLCHDARTATSFLGDTLGLSDEAANLRMSLRTRLASLDHWPVVEILWSRLDSEEADTPSASAQAEERLAQACARGAELARLSPQSIPPAGTWSDIQRSCPTESAELLLPPAADWYDRIAPPGTAVYGSDRLSAQLTAGNSAQTELQGLAALAPFDTTLLQMLPQTTDAETIRARFGTLADYDLAAMLLLAQTLPRDEAISVYQRLATWRPDTYLTLGHLLREMGSSEAAVAALEDAIAKAQDRVAVSAHVLWLVGYYCDTGRVERARAIAQMAAEVYSAGGLETMGYLMERLGRYPEAEAWYRRIEERYDDRRALDAFYVRYEYRIGDSRYRTQAVAALARVFPGGLRRVSILEFEGLPPSMFGFSRRPGSNVPPGFEHNDVVVALNGYAIQDRRQYDLIESLDDRSADDIVVWRAGRYVQITRRVLGTRYGAISKED